MLLKKHVVFILFFECSYFTLKSAKVNPFVKEQFYHYYPYKLSDRIYLLGARHIV